MYYSLKAKNTAHEQFQGPALTKGSALTQLLLFFAISLKYLFFVD